MGYEDNPRYEKWRIREYPHWVLYLHTNQYYLGRAYAWLKRPGEMQDFADLTFDELFELRTSVLLEYKAALVRLWQPGLMNYAWLGNHMHIHKGHGHMHIIPRYEVPRNFAGHEFHDARWGENYAPSPKLELPGETLLLIRDALRRHLR